MLHQNFKALINGENAVVQNRQLNLKFETYFFPYIFFSHDFVENKFDFYVYFTTVYIQVLVIDFLAFIEQQNWGKFAVI